MLVKRKQPGIAACGRPAPAARWWTLCIYAGLIYAPTAEKVWSQTARRSYPISSKILRYSERLIETYDNDGNGELEQTEWRMMRGDPQIVDKNGDGVITLAELARRVWSYGRRRKIRLRSPPRTAMSSSATDTGATVFATDSEAEGSVSNVAAPRLEARRFYVSPGELPEGLPEWFTQRDRNGDGQLSITEFSESASRTDVGRFERYDTNRDGVVTAQECAAAGVGDAPDSAAPEG